MYISVKKISGFIALAIALLFEMNTAFAQVVQTESFDGVTFPPTDWSLSGGGPGGNLWVRRTNGTNPTCTTHSGAAMARFTAFNIQNGAQEVMTTPVINLAGSLGSQATFSLWVYRDNSSTAGDSMTIFVNTENSLINAERIGAVARSRFFVLPVNETANGWYNYSFNIPTTFNTDTNYVLLQGTSHGGGNIYVDDVEWTEYPTACSAPVAGGVAAIDSLICGGSGSTDLSLTGSGLTGGGLTFQWQSAPDSTGPWTNFGGSAATTNTGTITDSTWFRCYVTCSVGSVTDTSSATLVQVSSSPAPVIILNVGPTVNFCTQAPPVTVAAAGAQAYTWSPTVTTNVTGDSAFIAPTITTTYTIIGMDSSGCSGSASVTFNVTNSPNVVANSNNDTICPGTSVNLNAFVQGPGFGIQYVWEPGSLSGANQTVTPQGTTIYVVAATNNQTGCTGYDTVTIVVNPSPAAGFTFNQNNLTYTFTDTSTGSPVSWFWDFGDGDTDNVQNPVHTYLSNGTYTVLLTVSNGICTETITQVITVVSVHDLQLMDGKPVSLYPNPVSESALIKFSCSDKAVSISITNYLGEVVLRKEVESGTGEFTESLDFKNYKAGFYLIQIRSEKSSANLKLIKE